MKNIKIVLFIFLVGCLVSCSQPTINNSLSSDRLEDSVAIASENSNLAEVAAPKIIKQLNQKLEQYLPQVEIVAPQPEKTYKQTDLEIKLKIEALPVFRDDKLQLGNHLNLIIDNEPLQEIYTPDEPILIKGLSPGTHTIRAFAVRPWGESFKNEGAYAQTTFNVLTKTNDNRPESSLPLLTYSSPSGTINAEPLLLDYYLTNASLNAIADNQQNSSNLLVRATVSGTSFILEDWQSVYLTGLEPGENWVQLELIDEEGNNIENAFNNTVRVFTYNPQQQDTLAQLLSNKIPLAEAQSIVEQYYTQPVEMPKIIDFEDSTEPEIVTDVANDLVESKPTTLEEVNEPNIVETSDSENDSIKQPKSLASNKLPSGSNNLQQNIKNQPEVDSIPLVDENSPTELELQKISQKVQPTEQVAIAIKEADSNSEDPAVTITIPQPESVEISESEIAVTIPQTNVDELVQPRVKQRNTQLKTPLWWQKFLVGLRHKIESLAELLPSET